MPQAPPGWYPDPYDPSLERRWDGAAWTNETTRLALATAPEPPGTVSWPPAPTAWRTPATEWSPPSAPLPEQTISSRRESTTNWRRLGIIAGAVILPVAGFIAGYAAHHSNDSTNPKVGFGLRPVSTTTTAAEPPNANVPGPTAPPGVDTAGIVAQQNLNMAAAIVTTVMHQRPGAVVTRHDLEAVNPNFAFDLPGTPIGGPGIVGAAVISTAVDQLPHAPRRVVLALPGNSACYYEAVVEGGAKQFGVARGADAVSHCFVDETAGGVPQVRPETKWTSQWPPATS